MIKYLFAASIVSIASAGVASANLLVNGDFATGNFSGWNVDGAGEPWTAVNQAPFFAGLPNAGQYSAAFGNVNSLGSISQSIATTVGTTYSLSFYFATNDSGNLPTFELYASENGNNLFSYASSSTASAALYSFYFVADSSLTEIKFAGMAPYNYLAINNVVLNEVAPVPEPATLGLLAAGLVATLRRRRRA